MWMGQLYVFLWEWTSVFWGLGREDLSFHAEFWEHKWLQSTGVQTDALSCLEQQLEQGGLGGKGIMASSILGCPNCTMFNMAYGNGGVCVVPQIQQTLDIWGRALSQGLQKVSKWQNVLAARLKVITSGALPLCVLAVVKELAGDIWARSRERHSVLDMLQLDHTLPLSWLHTFKSNTPWSTTFSRCTGNNPNWWTAISTKQSSCLEGSSQQLRSWPNVPWSTTLSTDFILVWINISQQKCWVSQICVLLVCLMWMFTFALLWM